MAVAEQFGKSASFADLPIQPSAAYLLAAPAVPDEARQVAIEKAEAGEEITPAVAKEIMAEAKKKRRPRRQKALATDKLVVRLVNVLERYKERWKSDDLPELALEQAKPPTGGRVSGGENTKSLGFPAVFEE
jgi:hypothetical protein